MDRRDFLKTVLRISALGGLPLLGFKALRGGLSGGAAAGGGLPGQTCIADGICARCAAVPGCGLPQALSYRQVKGS